MSGIVLIVHVTVCFALIIIVLLQAGKGADMGAAFGGASKTVFGPTGAAGPMAKITVGAAVLFMLTSLYLTWAARHVREGSVLDTRPAPTAPAVPGTEPVSIPITPGGEPITIPPPAPTGTELPGLPPLPLDIEPPSPAPGGEPSPPAESAPTETP